MKRLPKGDDDLGGQVPRPGVNSHADVTGPETQEEFKKLLSKGAAQALQSATTSAEYAAATKVAKDVYEALYGADKGGEWGSGLTQPNGAQTRP